MKIDMAGLPSVVTPFQRASTLTARFRSGWAAGLTIGSPACTRAWYACTRYGMKNGAAGRVLSPLSMVPIVCSMPCRYLTSIVLLALTSWLMSCERKIVPQYSSPWFCW